MGSATHPCIWSLFYPDVTADALPLTAAVLAQYVFQFVFYGIVVSGAFQRALSVDKGVKAVDRVKQRYGMGVCSLACLVSLALKAAAILAFVNILGASADSLCAYMEIAAFVSGVALTMVHNSLWEQRPAPLWLMTAFAEIVCGQVAAYVLFQLKH